MELWDYLYQGLRVRAEFPLTDWAPFAGDFGAVAPDVMISLGACPDSAGLLINETGDETKDALSADEYRFFVPEWGTIRVTGGREIVVTPLTGVQPGELHPWLAGSAWAALCYQRGLLLIHASAVAFGNGAIAFCGPTGCGKSTLAAHIHSLGHALVSDDLCRVDISGEGSAFIHPSAPRFKLRSDSLAGLGALTQSSGTRLECGAQKAQLWTRNWSPKPLPLIAIFLLNWGEPKSGLLTGSAALRGFLAAACYRGDLIEQMKRSATHVALSVEMLRRVPLWELARPRDLTRAEEIVRFIREDCSMIESWSNHRSVASNGKVCD